MIRQALVQAIAWTRKFLREKFHHTNPDSPYLISILVVIIPFIVSLNLFVSFTQRLAAEQLNELDTYLTYFIQSYRSDVLTSILKFVTHLGDIIGYTVICLGLAVYFYYVKIKWRVTVEIFITLILSSLGNLVLKQAFNRARPAAEHLVTVNTLSYPSGHAMSAMAFYGFLIYVTFRFSKRTLTRVTLSIICVLMIIAIGVSRVYLGVHYPSDVLAGFMAGLIWTCFCIVLFNLVDLFRKNRSVSHL